MKVSLGTVSKHLKVRLIDPPEGLLLSVTELPVVGHSLRLLNLIGKAPVNLYRVGLPIDLDEGGETEWKTKAHLNQIGKALASYLREEA